MKNKSSFILMYGAFFIYSLSTIFSKIASKQKFLSAAYILCFCAILFIMVLYAALWQIVLKKLPLSVAMANKPFALVCALFWAFFLFGEKFDVKTALGILLILAGIVIVSIGDREESAA
ncbi:MAG: EamA family transporter [Treponema sp.]|nr:EamA family transporter [Treponema sp.]